MPRSANAQHAHSSSWQFNAGALHSQDIGVVVGELTIAERIGRTLPPAAMDLIELVAAVHLADRGVRRPAASKAGDSWSRQIRLRLGVRDLDRWSEATIQQDLHALLRWLTDDEWAIDFVCRQAPSRSAECVRFLFETAPDAGAVALFSGGLDSLAGLAADVEQGVTPLAVSVWSNKRVSKSQEDVLASFNAEAGTSIARVPIELHLNNGPARESSQRARGFSFLALASVVAAVSGLDRVRVYENGIGSINLPYTAAQVGAHGTRSMHPLTLLRAASLFSRLLDHPLVISNPSQFVTKAEMCRRLPEALHPTVMRAESCDTAFATRKAGSHSCGRCTSCLLRRQSLAAAGLGHLDPGSSYQLDAFATEPTCPDLYELRAMLGQAAHIREAMTAPSWNRWSHLVREFPDLALAADALSVGGDAAVPRLLRLLQRYVEEWSAVESPLVRSYLPTAA